MSWETLVVGQLKFKENVNEEEKKKIIKEFEDVLECKLTWDEKWNEYTFQDVNWISHVSGEEILKAFKKWRHKLKYFSCSNYYLNEPHEDILFDREHKTFRVNLI